MVHTVEFLGRCCPAQALPAEHTGFGAASKTVAALGKQCSNTGIGEPLLPGVALEVLKDGGKPFRSAGGGLILPLFEPLLADPGASLLRRRRVRDRLGRVLCRRRSLLGDALPCPARLGRTGQDAALRRRAARGRTARALAFDARCRASSSGDAGRSR
jgi:hypothetical protein